MHERIARIRTILSTSTQALQEGKATLLGEYRDIETLPSC